jgi:hypothetical protein
VTRVFWRRVLRPSAVAGVGAALLSACAGAPHKPPPAPPAQALREEMPPPPPRLYRRVVPRPPHKPAPPAESARERAAKPAAPTLLAAPPRAGSLGGLDQKKAVQLFGRATEKIEQPPATIWRYKIPGCELDLFFYLDLRSGQMRTLHYAFRGDVGDLEKRQQCLRAIVAARAS